MTKAELVEMIAGETGISKKDTGIIVNLILDNIGRALISSDKVELRGFGSFKVKQRRSRLARNPRTGESVGVPAKKVPYFITANPPRYLNSIIQTQFLNHLIQSLALGTIPYQ